MSDRNLQLGVIGNCAIGALVDQSAEIVWACFPRLDGEPVFSSLLSKEQENIEGTFAIKMEDFSHSTQEYIKNTAILKTCLYDTFGNELTIIDFAPRFKQFGRFYHPLTIMRKLQAKGTPRCRVIVRPAQNDGVDPTKKEQGSNHIRYRAENWSMRLTTDLSVTYILEETPFIVDSTKHLIFGQDESITESIEQLVHRFYKETSSYWMEWCRYLAVPYEWQNSVIRSAITLKLSAYEDTGAIIAAMTTSIPEAANTTRNWDYRFCWLRDSFFTVNALNQLGATGTMEKYLQYIVNIVASMPEDKPLQPVFRINGKPDMPERIVENLSGYRGMGPVRIGNEAAKQIQHDVYGAVVLTAKHIFYDERIWHEGGHALFNMLEKVGERAKDNYSQPDAGLWELRNTNNVHTFSSIMCWAACDRLSEIAEKLELPKRVEYWRAHALKIRAEIDKRGFNTRLNSFSATWDGDTLDASLLLACDLGFVDGKDPRFVGTVEAIEKQLKPEGSRYLFRYVVEDDFGAPENAFTICTFWYIDALNSVGRRDEARELFEDLLSKTNHLGLLSEDIDPKTGELWGNYPQTYSLVGIINSAIALSTSWEKAL
ncbi:MAG: GH15 family glucan-1,4-alpha-glucosidase [Lentisphaeria bacterium]|jgi:GH15 family glucan-1,4-alpha-glucosidase